MAPVGRPRGRPSKRSQFQNSNFIRNQRIVTQEASSRILKRPSIPQFATPVNGLGAIKEDTGTSLHDPSDIVSFRAESLHRFITNHEYIENATSKLVHTLKIIPPRIFPEASSEEYEFSDLDEMRERLKRLEEQITLMKLDADSVDLKSQFLSKLDTVLSHQCDMLSTAYDTLVLSDANQILKPCLETAMKALFDSTQYSWVAHKVRPHGAFNVEIAVVPVDEAPTRYDPVQVGAAIARQASLDSTRSRGSAPFPDQYPHFRMPSEQYMPQEIDTGPESASLNQLSNPIIPDIGTIFTGPSDHEMQNIIYENDDQSAAIIGHNEFEDMVFSPLDHNIE